MPDAGVDVEGAGELSSFETHVVLNPRELAELLRGENGPVIRHLFTLGDKVKDAAKRKVGVSQPDPIPRAKPHKPGTLRDSIIKRVAQDGENVRVQVGSAVEYALWHHEGTPGGQIIRPIRAKALVFADREGNVQYRQMVVRGATPANRFLVEALNEVMSSSAGD